MPPKYYCDYCFKRFPDTGNTRKKHFESKHHKMMVKLYYDSLKDPHVLAEEEGYKVPCNNFLESGQCSFGIQCRFSHAPHLYPYKELIFPNVFPQPLLKLDGESVPPSLILPPHMGYDNTLYNSLDWGWKR